MSKEPKISVIVPVYKAEKYLHKCVDSLLAQTFTDFEILLIDDGSPDKSGEICDEYAEKDSRIRVFHKENGGVSAARNLGLNNSGGNYVAFVDSDDWVAPDYLKDFQIENLNPDEKFIVIQGIEQNYPKKKKPTKMFYYENEVLYWSRDIERIKDNNILLNGCPVAKLFSKEVISNNKLFFNTNISLNEDHLFFLNYLKFTDVIYTKKSINYHYLYDYRVPSLTKIRHSSQESIIAALELNSAFNCLVDKYGLNVNDFHKCYSLFGPTQLIRASIDTFFEQNKYKKFCNVIQQFKENFNRFNLLNFSNLYEKSYVFLISKNRNRYIFFLTQFSLYVSCCFYGKIKFLIKSIF